MKTNMKKSLTILAVLATTLAGFSQTQPQSNQVLPLITTNLELLKKKCAALKGRTAPELIIKTLVGEEKKLSDLQGKPVLVAFTSTSIGRVTRDGHRITDRFWTSLEENKLKLQELGIQLVIVDTFIVIPDMPANQDPATAVKKTLAGIANASFAIEVMTPEKFDWPISSQWANYHRVSGDIAIYGIDSDGRIAFENDDIRKFTPITEPNNDLAYAIQIAANLPQAPPFRRTITDTQGRQLDVTILNLGSDQVQLKRNSDGHEFTIPISKLAPSDREFLFADAKSALKAALNPPGAPPSPLTFPVTRNLTYNNGKQDAVTILTRTPLIATHPETITVRRKIDGEESTVLLTSLSVKDRAFIAAIQHPIGMPHQEFRKYADENMQYMTRQINRLCSKEMNPAENLGVTKKINLLKKRAPIMKLYLDELTRNLSEKKTLKQELAAEGIHFPNYSNPLTIIDAIHDKANTDGETVSLRAEFEKLEVERPTRPDGKPENLILDLLYGAWPLIDYHCKKQHVENLTFKSFSESLQSSVLASWDTRIEYALADATKGNVTINNCRLVDRDVPWDRLGWELRCEMIKHELRQGRPVLVGKHPVVVLIGFSTPDGEAKSTSFEGIKEGESGFCQIPANSITEAYSVTF